MKGLELLAEARGDSAVFLLSPARQNTTPQQRTVIRIPMERGHHARLQRLPG